MIAGSRACLYVRPAGASLDKIKGHYGKAAKQPGLRMFRNVAELCEGRSLPRWLKQRPEWQEHAPAYALMVDISNTLELTYHVRAAPSSCWKIHAAFALARSHPPTVLLCRQESASGLSPSRAPRSSQR